MSNLEKGLNTKMALRQSTIQNLILQVNLITMLKSTMISDL